MILNSEKRRVSTRVQRDSDRALALAAAAHDAAARRRVVERLLDRVRTTVYYLAPAHPDADDMVQMALVEVLRGLGGFRGDARLETWADRINVLLGTHP